MKKVANPQPYEPQEPEDDEIDGEIEFYPCDKCDLPDACEDFGCAIKNGVKKSSRYDLFEW